MLKRGKSPAVSIRCSAYAMVTTDGQSAEITMYGDIYEQRPVGWDGEPIDGQFILLSDFLEDLEQVAGCKKITIRMNSYGGDAGVSNTIHNRLRELARNGTELTCVVDGVAMSGGSLIMSACDHVVVNPSSIIMIHKCWSFMFGGYNADEMRQLADQNDAWDKMQVEIYKRKTGLKDEEILGMMAETTYMTGREAAEKGFADEILDDAEPLNIAASADGRCIFVHGRMMHMAPGMFAPDSIPTVNPRAKASVKTNTKQPVGSGAKGGKETMAKELEELRAENPELAEKLMAAARKAVATEGRTADGVSPAPETSGDDVDAAVQAEQKRIQEIDAVAGLYDADTVNAAKYGDNACTAQEMVYRAAQKAAQQGKKFLASVFDDAMESGVSDVGAVPPAKDDPNAQKNSIEQAKADARAFNAQKKEVR